MNKITHTNSFPSPPPSSSLYLSYLKQNLHYISGLPTSLTSTAIPMIVVPKHVFQLGVIASCMYPKEWNALLIIVTCLSRLVTIDLCMLPF